MSTKPINTNIVEDLIRLRDELGARAFTMGGRVQNDNLAEVVYKINSCLYKGYPKRVER